MVPIEKNKNKNEDLQEKVIFGCLLGKFVCVNACLQSAHHFLTQISGV